METSIYPSLKFRSRKFILIDERGNKSSGAIYDPKMFENFGPSFMRLFPDGTIRRSSEIIGTIEDIEWLNDLPLEIL